MGIARRPYFGKVRRKGGFRSVAVTQMLTDAASRSVYQFVYLAVVIA